MRVFSRRKKKRRFTGEPLHRPGQDAPPPTPRPRTGPPPWAVQKLELSSEDQASVELGKAAVAAVHLIRNRYYEAKVWEYIVVMPLAWVLERFNPDELATLQRAGKDLDIAMRHLIGDLSHTEGGRK
jgi:hypothetical protein